MTSVLHDFPPWQRWLLPVLLVLVAATWLAGGVTLDPTGLDESLQLLALPVLMLAFASLAYSDAPRSRLHHAAIAACGVVVCLPLLQLLPVAPSAGAAREALAADLRVAGVSEFGPTITLSPQLTEAALWSLLPALAVFLGGLSLSADASRRVAQAVVAVILINLLFAFFQAGLPRDSALRLYQDFDAGFGGLLVNTNHHATALLVGMSLALGLMADARRRHSGGRRNASIGYAALAGLFLLAVPLSTSRAGVALALPMLVLALFATGTVSLRKLRRDKRSVGLLLALLALAMVGAWSIRGWMAVDEVEEMRHALARATVDIGRGYAPWGSGIGTFIPVFEQGASKSLMLGSYVNHAHNEYAQWWLTGGIPAVIALLAALGVLLATGWSLARAERARPIAASCLIAVLAVLAHSVAEYPLRTLALMTTTALLAGVAVAGASRRSRPG